MQALSNYQTANQGLFSFAFSQSPAILTQKIAESGYEKVENGSEIMISAKELTSTMGFVHYKDKTI